MKLKITSLSAAAILCAGLAQAGTIIDATFNGTAGSVPDPAVWLIEDANYNLQNGSGGVNIFSPSFAFGVRALNTYGAAPGAGETITATFGLENIVDSGVSAPTVLALLDASYGLQIYASNESGSGFWALHVAGQSGEIATTVEAWYLPPTVSIAWSADDIVLTVNGGGTFGVQVVSVAASRPDWTIPTAALQPGMFDYAYSGNYGGNNTANEFVNSVTYASVPEPSTVLLAGIGIGAVAFGLRRRAAKA